MGITYNQLINYLKDNYKAITIDGEHFFVNEDYEAVASFDEKRISLFFHFPESDGRIFNHNGIVIATVSKDFQVNDQVCDVLFLEGACGSCNDSITIDNFAYEMTLNHILNDTFAVGSIGDIWFIDDSISLGIGDDIVIDGLKENHDTNMSVNVLKVTGINKNFDYNLVYNYWTRRNSYVYEDKGHKNYWIDKERNWIERRKNSTIDEDDINYVDDPYYELMCDIYNKKDGSLNSKKLQMKQLLSHWLSNDEVDKYLSSFDFSKRKVDVKKAVLKRN